MSKAWQKLSHGAVIATSSLLSPFYLWLMLFARWRHYFPQVDSNKLWQDVQNEENVICAKFGKDLYNIAKVIGHKKVAQFFLTHSVHVFATHPQDFSIAGLVHFDLSLCLSRVYFSVLYKLFCTLSYVAPFKLCSHTAGAAGI